MQKKLFHYKKLVVLTLVVLMAAAGLAYAASTAAQVSSLSGTVLADGLISTGAHVTEGQVLVNVSTLAGAAPAARANCSGTVVSVSVSPGSRVSAGQVVAQIQQ